MGDSLIGPLIDLSIGLLIGLLIGLFTGRPTSLRAGTCAFKFRCGPA